LKTECINEKLENGLILDFKVVSAFAFERDESRIGKWKALLE